MNLSDPVHLKVIRTVAPLRAAFRKMWPCITWPSWSALSGRLEGGVPPPVSPPGLAAWLALSQSRTI